MLRTRVQIGMGLLLSERKRTDIFNYQLIELGYKRLGISEKYYIQKYYFVNGNVLHCGCDA